MKYGPGWEPRAVDWSSTRGRILLSASVLFAQRLRDSGLSVQEVAPHTEGLGQANVVAVDASGAFTAAADPRADGSGTVAQYARPESGTATG